VTKLREKAQGQVKRLVGQMVGDEKLVWEGKEQERKAERQTMDGADQGIARDEKGQEQPKDKDRAQTVHKTGAEKSTPGEPTRKASKRKGPVLE
jgi:uncharacterized protein YjbJ (UPF0337 family)